MANKSCKHVLMTTMSILPKDRNINYYYKKNDNSARLFCDGISSLEPGSKYFLSKYLIDEIVVIGTTETIQKNDKREYSDIQEVCEEINAFKVHGDISAYSLYKYRIGTFLREKGLVGGEFDKTAVDLVAKDIPEKRRMELTKLYREKCTENPFTKSKEEGAWKEVQEFIKNSIEQKFQDTEAYQEYLSKMDLIKQYQDKYWENLVLEGTADKIIRDIRRDEQLSLLEKEYCYLDLQKKVSEAKLENRIIDLKTDIIGLEMEIDHLKYELGALKERRQKTEFAYLKYVVFCDLPEECRLYPLEENTNAQNNPISLRFVDEQIGENDTIDNINGIVNTLYGETDEDTEIKLYIDMQGGNRTSSYVRNAIISILCNQVSKKVQIVEIVGTNYNPKQQQGSEIVNETRRYRITDLVSGMNAFIRYGKADMIQEYCSFMKKENEEDYVVSCLVECMVAVDDAISLCNVQALGDAIVRLSNILNSKNESLNQTEISTSFIDNVFQILREGIKKDYGKLLQIPKVSQKIDYLELISWCSRKGFLQQALTLIEDKMPGQYFEENILKYQFDKYKHEIRFNKDVGQSYEDRIENNLFYNLPFYVVGGPMFEMLWFMKAPDSEKRRKDDWETELKEFQEKRKDSKVFREYLIEQLLTHQYNKDNWSVNRQDIEKLAENLNVADDSETLITKYCLFRMLEKAVEKGYQQHDLTTAGILHRLVKKRMKGNGVDTHYHSIMGYLGTKKYIVKNTSMLIELKLGSNNLNTPIMMNKLDRMFLLHDALKQERNCSNHASQKGIRLSSEVVKRAIDAYVEMVREVRSVIKGAI